MTREEFEYAIKSCGCFIYRGHIYYEETELMKAFEDMGLIEQEPSGDAMSREELLKAIAYKIWTSTESVGDDYKYIKSVSKPTGIEFDEEQEQLDFVQSHKSIPVKLKVEPSGDAISRQAVLETLDDMDNVLDEDRTIENYKELLKECYEVLPPVKPQEPKESDHKCHTCKHYTSEEHDGSCGSYICNGYSDWESEDKE